MSLRETRCFIIFTGLLTRFLFIFHSFAAVWYMCSKKDDLRWWLFSLGTVLIMVETVIIISANNGREWNCIICPSFLCYLLSVLPPIWIIELDKAEIMRQNLNFINLTTSFKADFFGLTRSVVDVTLTDHSWVMSIEQSLVYLLIIARWMLPVKYLHYDNLSNYLLLYIGTAADILELLDLLQTKTIVDDPLFVRAILGAFSMSLFQFTYVLILRTQGEDSDTDLQGNPLEPDEERHETCGFCRRLWSASDDQSRMENFALILALVMQYFPFVVIRLISVVKYKGGASYSNIFFLIKNVLLFLLSTNRILVMFYCKCGKGRQRGLDNRQSHFTSKRGTDGGRSVALSEAPSISTLHSDIGISKAMPSKSIASKGPMSKGITLKEAIDKARVISKAEAFTVPASKGLTQRKN